MVEYPPSICITWPVIQLALSDKRNSAMLAMSAGWPFLFSGFFAALASFFSSVFRSFAASGVSVKDGAIQFTLIFGENSAANALVKPSIAHLMRRLVNDKGIRFAQR